MMTTCDVKMKIGFTQIVGAFIIAAGVAGAIIDQDAQIMVQSWLYGSALIGGAKIVQDMKSMKAGEK